MFLSMCAGCPVIIITVVFAFISGPAGGQAEERDEDSWHRHLKEDRRLRSEEDDTEDDYDGRGQTAPEDESGEAARKQNLLDSLLSQERFDPILLKSQRFYCFEKGNILKSRFV